MLGEWQAGNRAALDQLTPLIYEELRSLARYYMHSERGDHTLQATALVNEAYLRLIDLSRMSWRSRAHFFAVAAQLIRHILVDHARSRQALKRGGNLQKLSLDQSLEVSAAEQDVDLVALDDALEALAQLNPQQSRVVELRYFAGLSIEETAEVLGVSVSTIKRQWALARSWLHTRLSD